MRSGQSYTWWQFWAEHMRTGQSDTWWQSRSQQEVRENWQDSKLYSVPHHLPFTHRQETPPIPAYWCDTGCDSALYITITGSLITVAPQNKGRAVAQSGDPCYNGLAWAQHLPKARAGSNRLPLNPSDQPAD